MCHFILESKNGIWPYYNSEPMQDELERLGLVSKTQCGEATIICSPIHEMVDTSDRLLHSEPEKWFSQKSSVDWLKRYGLKEKALTR